MSRSSSLSSSASHASCEQLMRADHDDHAAAAAPAAHPRSWLPLGTLDRHPVASRQSRDETAAMLAEQPRKLPLDPSASKLPQVQAVENVGCAGASATGAGADDQDADVGTGDASDVPYKTYRRRWFGLVQLVLLNIVVSWDWLSFAANSTTSADFFGVSETAINWLSTSYLLAFVVCAPVAMYVLNRGGPKPAIVVCAVLTLAGNWIRYGGCKAGRQGNFGVVFFGQILTGLAQPLVLTAPTRYSDLWFTNTGRVAATAVMSLANPLGGALGELIDPFWAASAKDIPNMVLYVSIVATVASIPAFFIPAAPPTPVAPSGEASKMPIRQSLSLLCGRLEFWLIMIPFWIFVALFNTVSTVINSVLSPYGFDETESGIAGGAQIIVGLIASAIVSPLIDRSKTHLLAIKILCPIASLCYLVFVFMPPTEQLAAVVVVLAVLGAASFSLLPVALEFLAEITHPISPEVTSVVSWVGGQLLGAVFIIVEGALKDGPHGGPGGATPNNMQRALWFQAILAMLILPLPLALGRFGRAQHVALRRVEADGGRKPTAPAGA